VTQDKNVLMALYEMDQGTYREESPSNRDRTQNDADIGKRYSDHHYHYGVGMNSDWYFDLEKFYGSRC
jgi:hypothetical protein